VKFAAILLVAVFLSVPGLRAHDLSTSLPAEFAYVANFDDSNLSGYTINTATGVLTAIAGSPFSAGASPVWVVVDPSSKFLYVADIAVGSAIFGFTIDRATGALTSIIGSHFSVGKDPTSMTVDPSGKFVYVTNFGDNTISGYRIDSATGALTNIVGSPFASGPISVAVDPSGKFVYVTNSNGNGRDLAQGGGFAEPWVFNVKRGPL